MPPSPVVSPVSSESGLHHCSRLRALLPASPFSSVHSLLCLGFSDLCLSKSPSSGRSEIRMFENVGSWTGSSIGSVPRPPVARRKNASGNKSDIGWKHGIDVQGNAKKV
ncbi:hypothetical protein PIB30_064089 [Stylosanthes scabra]|uniref:Uncharacterized protein n=1 Tax=Stylosanthes scabra TaxID=79078 RepID=A0ABU6XLZ2_9FABA|nr:hypothetical protein [Stylosanthes scabra]